MELITEENEYDEYFKYLHSQIWAEKRNEALIRDGFHCSICQCPHNIEVHHLRYPDVLGTESVSDLMTLCRDCHKNLEAYKKGHKQGSITKWKAPSIPAHLYYINCEGEEEARNVRDRLIKEWNKGKLQKGNFRSCNEIRLYNAETKLYMQFHHNMDDTSLEVIKEICKTELLVEIKEGKDG